MWTVALSSLKQCAKTYEIRHTPTPVRVTEALQAAVLEGCGTTREGKGGTSTGLVPQVQVQASSQPPGRSSGRPSWGMGRLRAAQSHRWDWRGKRVKCTLDFAERYLHV